MEAMDQLNKQLKSVSDNNLVLISAATLAATLMAESGAKDDAPEEK